MVAAMRSAELRRCSRHAVLFVTDEVWPDLQRLAGYADIIAEHGGRTAVQLGIRATPTLVVLAIPQRRVTAIEVGTEAVRARLSALQHQCSPTGGVS